MPHLNDNDRSRNDQSDAEIEAILRTALGLNPAARTAVRNHAAGLLQHRLFQIAFAVARQFPAIDAHDCAIDAVQDWWCVALAFAFVFRDLDRPLWPYCRQCLRYITIGRAMRQRRYLWKDFATLDATPASTASEDRMEASDCASAIFRVITQFPAEVQTLLLMRIERQMTYSAIALELGVPQARVFRQIRLAFAYLRHRLEHLSP